MCCWIARGQFGIRMLNEWIWQGIYVTHTTLSYAYLDFLSSYLICRDCVITNLSSEGLHKIKCSLELHRRVSLLFFSLSLTRKWLREFPLLKFMLVKLKSHPKTVILKNIYSYNFIQKSHIYVIYITFQNL